VTLSEGFRARTGRGAAGELAHARDFDSYGAQMDAALAQKLEDLLPWIVPGLVVDKGCGTGKLLVELSRRFPTSAFVGVDLSREFLRRCDENTYYAEDVVLVAGNACDVSVPDATATTIVLSSIVHEIWTYSGYSLAAVERALAAAARELRPGGVLLVRDGVSPGRMPLRMRFLGPEVAATFARFAIEYKHGTGVAYRQVGPDTVELDAHLANEFLCKKDYQKNWHIEVHEEFGTFTLSEWRDLIERAGLRLVAQRALVNPWIVEHRYRGSLVLEDAHGTPVPWPATNVVVVAERVVG
jgi:SAM-dependent methyltransferase